MSSQSWSSAACWVLAGALLMGAGSSHAVIRSSAVLIDSAVVDGNDVGTRAACATAAPYAARVTALSPTLYWRVGDTDASDGATVGDSSGNGQTGTVHGAGLTFGGAGLIQCDDTGAATFPGTVTSTQFIADDNAVANPDEFTVSAWVRTGSTQGGWVVGMGSARWGTSANRDRVLFVGSDGRPAFAVGIGPRTILSGPTAIDDGQPHLLVGTVGPAGMALYVDGVAVAVDGGVTSGASYTGNETIDPSPPALPIVTPDGQGYWRVGYDRATDLGPAAPTRDQLNGEIDEVAIWATRSLTPADVASLYAGNHW